jgi:hypothetical protein
MQERGIDYMTRSHPLFRLAGNGATVYAASPEDMSHLSEIFAGLHVLAWPPHLASPPDVVVSSSVVQHVGDRAAQLDYVASVLALGERAFLSTPNRRHWLEFHTKLPLLHWLPKARHRRALARIGMEFWAQERNLNLLDREEFETLIAEAAARNGTRIRVQWYRPRFLGAVSHLVALVTRAA